MAQKIKKSAMVPGLLESLDSFIKEKNEKEISLESALNEMADLFDFQASKEKRKGESKDSIWEFDPVSPLEFCKGEDYLNLGQEIYPVVLKDLADTFPGDPRNLKNKYEEIIFDEAIGSGKCLSGKTNILLSNGEQKTIAELYENNNKILELFSLNEETGKIEKQLSNDILNNGIKDIWRITTRCGREIESTDNHMFIVNGYWKELKDIKEKEFIAVPSKVEFKGEEVLNDDEIKLIAYLIGDGSCTQINDIGFASIDEETIDEFRWCFNNNNSIDTVRMEDYYKNSKLSGLILRGSNKKESDIAKLLSKVGLLYHNSSNKFIPKEIKMSTERQIGLFLNRLWSTDGSIDVHKCGVGYGTISKQLAKDVAFCLSRLGIRYNLSTRNKKIKEGQYKTITGDTYISYEVWPIIEDTSKFFEKVGFIIGNKYEQSIKCLENFNSKKRNTNIDCIPLNYEDAKHYAKLAGYNGLSGNLKKYKMSCNFSKTKFKEFISEDGIKDLHDSRLTLFASDDIFWDRIEKIEYVGKETVYDISMPLYHNFIANDIIVHNSFKLSILASYMAYKLLCLRNPQKTFNLAPSSKIAIMNMSVSASQAKRVVFGEIKNKLDYSPWFQRNYPPNPRIRSELQFDWSPNVPDPDRIYKNIYIIPGSSSGFAPLGYNLFCGIIDEATLWRDTDNKDYVEEVYSIIKRRITSRFMDKGLIVLGGSPMYSTDFLEKRIKQHEEAEEKDSKIMVRRRSHWDAKYPDYNGPIFYFHLEDSKVFEDEEKLNKERDRVAKKAGKNWKEAVETFDKQIKEIPMMYYDDFKNNPEGSKRDLGGWPSDTISKFIDTPGIIEEGINYKRKDPVKAPYMFKKWFGPVSNKIWHAIHIDLALTGDCCGIAMGHPDGFTEEGGVNIFIDFIMEIQGSKEKPVQIEDIRKMIYSLTKMGFMIGKITMDGFQSADNMQILRKNGYLAEYLSVDRSLVPYEEWKAATYENRINVYYHEKYINEAKKLEKIKNKKIDHPRNGSKDCTDAVAGVVNSCIELATWDPPEIEDENQVLTF